MKDMSLKDIENAVKVSGIASLKTFEEKREIPLIDWIWEESKKDKVMGKIEWVK